MEFRHFNFMALAARLGPSHADFLAFLTVSTERDRWPHSSANGRAKAQAIARSAPTGCFSPRPGISRSTGIEAAALPIAIADRMTQSTGIERLLKFRWAVSQTILKAIWPGGRRVGPARGLRQPSSRRLSNRGLQTPTTEKFGKSRMI